MLEIVPDIAQSTHGIRNIFADIRNVPTSVLCGYDYGYLKLLHILSSSTCIRYGKY